MPRVPANPHAPKPPSRTAHSCPECGKVFSRKEYVVRHQRLKHVNQEQPHLCETCHASFPSLPQLSRHRTSAHPKEPPASPRNEPKPLQSPRPQAAFPLPPIPALLRPPYKTSESSNDHLPTIGSEHHFPIDAVATAAPTLSLKLPPQPPSYPLPSTSRFPEPHHPSASSSHFHPRSPPIYANGTSQEVAAYAQQPENLSPYTFFNSALPPLAVQLLLDSAAFPPAVRGSVPSGGIGSQYVGADGRVAGAPGTRLVQGSEFRIRVIALLGSAADWGLAHELDGRAAPGTNGEDLVRSPRFFPRAQPFCVGYRDAWQIPPLPRLSRYASLATSFLLAQIPIIHKPTMFHLEMTPQVAFALAVAGAGLEDDGREFHASMVKEKRIFAIHHLHELELSELEMFSVLQSLSIYNFLGLFHEDPQQRIYSAASHAVLISTYRYHGLPQRVNEIDWEPPHASASPQDVEASWREWIRLETLTRITFMVFLLDLTMTNTFGAVPSVNPSELPIALPSSDALWSAPTSAAWAHLLTLPQFDSRPPCFLKIVDLLLSPSPSPSSTPADPILEAERSEVLGQVASLSPFALVVLSETLARLEIGLRAKAVGEEERREDGRDSPEVALRKVLHGAKVLEKISGSAGAAGGWFKPVRPIFQ